MDRIKKKHIVLLIIALKLALICVIVFKYLPDATPEDLRFDKTFFWFMLAGFLAQAVDGALGMAYGITSNSVLLWFGMSPKVASAAVHTAEIFTTGVSGLSHMRFGNFDKRLFLKLVVPGVISAAIGAYLIGNIFDGGIIKPYITVYILFLGGLILVKAFRNSFSEKKDTLKRAPLLAFWGAFCDAIGGGGWGPIVTSNLINKGHTPHKVIGTVNTAEFFITFVTSGILIYFSGIKSWQVILGLVIGGTIAAPFSAYVSKKIKRKPLQIIVGTLIIIISVLSLIRYFSQTE